MERPIFKAPGTPVEELDTPAFVIDLDVLDQNIETVHSFFRGQDSGLRPHVEAHRCPAIASMQLASEGTVGGVSVNTVGLAEHFANAGVRDIYVANPIVTRIKIERLCRLARRARVRVYVDNARNAEALSEAASALGVNLDAAVGIDTGLHVCGVAPGSDAVELAKAIDGLDGLQFVGFATYEGRAAEDSAEDIANKSREVAATLVDTKNLGEGSGLGVEVLSAGGTHNYEVMGAIAGITEVCAGAYALLDSRYASKRPNLRPAARVMATVIGRPEPGLAITDTGQKAAGADFGLAHLDAGFDANLKSLSAEHGSLALADDEAERLKMGDHAWYIPSDVGTTSNLFDYMHAVRDGRLETVWQITGRGLYR